MMILTARKSPVYFNVSKTIEPSKLELLEIKSIEFKIISFIPDIKYPTENRIEPQSMP